MGFIQKKIEESPQRERRVAVYVLRSKVRHDGSHSGVDIFPMRKSLARGMLIRPRTPRVSLNGIESIWPVERAATIDETTFEVWGTMAADVERPCPNGPTEGLNL